MLYNYNYFGIITILFTNCYEAWLHWLELHVDFILTNYDSIHTIMISMMSDLHNHRNISLTASVW